jgi:hypothetical protein
MAKKANKKAEVVEETELELKKTTPTKLTTRVWMGDHWAIVDEDSDDYKAGKA